MKTEQGNNTSSDGKAVGSKWKEILEERDNVSGQINTLLSEFILKYPEASVSMVKGFSNKNTVLIGFSVDLNTLTEDDLVVFREKKASVRSAIIDLNHSFS